MIRRTLRAPVPLRSVQPAARSHAVQSALRDAVVWRAAAGQSAFARRRHAVVAAHLATGVQPLLRARPRRSEQRHARAQRRGGARARPAVWQPGQHRLGAQSRLPAQRRRAPEQRTRPHRVVHDRETASSPHRTAAAAVANTRTTRAATISIRRPNPSTRITTSRKRKTQSSPSRATIGNGRPGFTRCSWAAGWRTTKASDLRGVPAPRGQRQRRVRAGRADLRCALRPGVSGVDGGAQPDSPGGTPHVPPSAPAIWMAR